MKTIIDLLEEEVKTSLKKLDIDKSYAKVTISDRPDISEYQCNAAMSLSKILKKNPFDIASDIASNIEENEIIENIDVVRPGFININVSPAFLSQYLLEISKDEMLGVDKIESDETIIVDYGGPNIAKPLHVGHLRSAVIGQAIKQILKFKGCSALGDIHLGDYGLQMGLVINELFHRNPTLNFFDPSYEGEYDTTPFFTLKDLSTLYPFASKKSKEDEEYYKESLQFTKRLQEGERGIRTLWQMIVDISVEDLKRNYERLNVEFDLWYGEESASKYVDGLVNYLKENDYAYYSDNALVVDIKEDTDKKEVPPCIILKSDGSSLYTTTDLATIMQRKQDFNPSRILYVVDNRQAFHFEQVFRCAYKTKLVDSDIDLKFLGFGTMNGKDGKPFKTKEGGNLSLEALINETEETMLGKLKESDNISEGSSIDTAKIVALAALKYGDLSNIASKDYIFDLNKFTSFEGNTGPYILYTIVRIKSLINKFTQDGGKLDKCKILSAFNDSDKKLQTILSRFNIAFDETYNDLAPHKLCAYIYDLSNALNTFYHENKILTQEDVDKKTSWIAILNVAKMILEKSIEILGFSAPEKM